MFKLLILLLITSMSFFTAKANNFVSPEMTEQNNINENNSQAENQAQATYILQVSSNLGCEYLDIDLISNKLNAPQKLRFTSSAYSAIKLPQGDYSFGNVICSNNEEKETFNMLSDKISSFSVVAGEIYFGGRLIFQKVEATNDFETPEVLDNCTQLNSTARGEPSNECRDGVGVNTSVETQYQINAFAPDVTEKDIQIVSSALSLSESQLNYLPIKYIRTNQ